jgi:ubiquinone biosynthesis protein
MTMPGLTTPGGAFKSIKRFQHVVGVFAKYGFGHVLNQVHVWECVHIERGILKRECTVPELTIPQRLRLALQELGPTFIKMGQLLSTRPDLIPGEYISELKKLQASVDFIPADVIREIIESELGKPISELFESFEDKPLAAASLAQVHRAVYKGEQVVLKVQRPDITEITAADIEIMRSLSRLAERYYPALYSVNATGLVEEFAEQLKKELDFRMEANNIRRFKHNFDGDDMIHVPEVYMDLCTRRVVTMEFLDGINISDAKRLKDEGYNLGLIARRGAILGFRSTFEYGFFHADPHPGNVLVLPDNVIGLVDFGMMASLSLRDRERLAKLVYFITIHDEKRVARALNELMESEDIIPAEDLESSMSGIINDYSDVAAGELKLAGMLFAMMRAIINHGGRLRPQMLWVTKSIAIQEEIAHSLRADFNLMDLGKPFAEKIINQKLNPFGQSYGIYYWLIDALDTIRDLPYDIGVVFRELRRGRIKIEFEHVGLEPLRLTIERFGNRTSLSIVIAALLLSSSMIVGAKLAPFVGNIPLLAFIGYISSLILGVVLIISVIRRR